MSKKEITPSNGVQHNVLSNGTIITGNIKSEEDFRIDGIVDGNIDCKGKIIVGPNGKIKGEINCTVLDLSGVVEGIVRCSDMAIMRSTALFIGELSMSILEVEPNAEIRAAIQTLKEEVLVG